MMSTFRLLYPESRVVGVDLVLSQGFDAKVNAAVDEHVRQHGVFPDDPNGPDEYAAFVATIPAPDVEEAIELLEDLGLATFARREPEDDEPAPEPCRFAVAQQGRTWSVIDTATGERMEGGFFGRDAAVASALQWARDTGGNPHAFVASWGNRAYCSVCGMSKADHRG